MIVNLLKLDYLCNSQLHWKGQNICSSRNIGVLWLLHFDNSADCKRSLNTLLRSATRLMQCSLINSHSTGLHLVANSCFSRRTTDPCKYSNYGDHSFDSGFQKSSF